MSEVAILTTSAGEMILEFWPDVAPGHVKNFKDLANKGFYDGTCFHRVIKGFMIQGGDPLTKDASKEDHWGTGGPGYQIKAEFNDKPHTRGVLSMARSRIPIRPARNSLSATAIRASWTASTPRLANSFAVTTCSKKSPPRRPIPVTDR